MLLEQEQGIYEFGNFQLDIGKGILLREGQPVSMQWKTFELLCTLVKSSGNLITTNELMDELWADTFVEENNLRQHISALRKALGENGNGCKFIETVPRRGYRFLPEVRVVDYAEQPPNSAMPNNLSAQQTALIGREKEITEIKNLLRCDDVRLLTLTGVGGTGKTTLAQAVAREFLTDFEDGVFFVELAAVTNPEFVASTIAKTLGVKETGGKPILEVMKDYLREKQLLLVIDNFEQVLSAAPLLSEILKNTTDLKILVTSRARLNLSKDYEFVVPPLAVPESSAQVSPSELSENESVRLFVERARVARPNFSLSEENAPSVTEICVRLEGLPLAIELAAARTRIISPQSILERLENRLKLLTGGAKDLPARQQTVRATVEWSYELLDENEKFLFRRLAVFAGGFTFEAAEAVCGSDEHHKDQIKVLDAVTSLIDKSLLIQKAQTDNEPRFRMLEVVREYAVESLEASGEAEAMRRSHAAFFLALGEKAEPLIQGAESGKWLDLLEEEHDNLRAALQWSLENDIEMAARLAAAIRFFWLFHSHLTEASEWMEKAVRKSSNIPASVRFKLLNGLGVSARNHGNYDMSQKFFEEGLTQGKDLSLSWEDSLAKRGLGIAAMRKGDFKSARNNFERAFVISRELNDKSEIAHALGCLGGLEIAVGNYPAAKPSIEEALEIFRHAGNIEAVSAMLYSIGIIAYREGNFRDAHLHFTEALKIAWRLGDKMTISYSLEGLASIATVFGKARLGAQISGAAENLRESIGYKFDPNDQPFRDEYLAKLSAELSEVDFANLYEQGRKMKLEKAIKLALESV